MRRVALLPLAAALVATSLPALAQSQRVNQQMAAQYQALSQQEQNRGIAVLAQHFARKADEARAGAVLPDATDTWGKPPAELASAASIVEEVMASKVVDENPQMAAATQVRFDCWLGRTGIGDTAGSRLCRDEFFSANRFIQTRHAAALKTSGSLAPLYAAPAAPATVEPAAPVVQTAAAEPMRLGSSAPTAPAPVIEVVPVQPAAPIVATPAPQPAPQPLAAPAAEPVAPAPAAVQVTAVPAPAPVVEVTPAEPAPIVEVAVTAPAPAPAAPVLQPVRYEPVTAPMWVAQQGKTLREVLESWSTQAGWQVYWKSQYEYPLQASATFRGTYLEAVEDILKSFQRVNPPVIGEVAPNRVLIIDNLVDRIYR